MINNTITLVESGEFGTTGFSIHFIQNYIKISPWYDIPYKGVDDTYNYINEIPRRTREKMEMIKDIGNHPIKQDLSNGLPRYFKYGPIPFNYGFISQTWENPDVKDTIFGKGGDNDPLDVVEISEYPIHIGNICQIKILGVLPMLDVEETDWKIIAISNCNPNYDKINSIRDVDEVKLGIIKDWFINYKTADGKKQNNIGEFLDKQQAIDIIDDTHEEFNKMKTMMVNMKINSAGKCK
jgi:inorganic pyrophosphatase